MPQPPSTTSQGRRVSGAMRAAAGCALALAALEVATLAGQSAPETYVSVLLGVAATATAAAAAALARGGGAVSRTVAGVLAGAVAGVVLLLVTVGRPGGHPMPLGAPSVLALSLAGAVLLLVAAEARRTRHRSSTGAKRSETDNSGHADPCSARGGRPGHRTDPRHRVGA